MTRADDDTVARSRRIPDRAAEDATLRGINLDRNLFPDLELLQRVGLNAQHLAGTQRRVIFVDIAEEHLVGDFRQPGGGAAAKTTQADVFRTNGDVDTLTRLEPVQRGDIEGEVGRELDDAAAVREPAHLARHQNSPIP